MYFLSLGVKGLNVVHTSRFSQVFRDKSVYFLIGRRNIYQVFLVSLLVRKLKAGQLFNKQIFKNKTIFPVHT